MSTPQNPPASWRALMSRFRALNPAPAQKLQKATMQSCFLFSICNFRVADRGWECILMVSKYSPLGDKIWSEHSHGKYFSALIPYAECPWQPCLGLANTIFGKGTLRFVFRAMLRNFQHLGDKIAQIYSQWRSRMMQIYWRSLGNVLSQLFGNSLILWDLRKWTGSLGLHAWPPTWSRSPERWHVGKS